MGPQREPGDPVLKTYRYLRTGMVALLVSLAVAVFYQSWRQGSFLASVSAYYYTPAQAVFVGALIGLGACMIALKGTRPVEDIALNLGGALATVVAVVPATRGADFRTAVRACEESGGPLLTRTGAGPGPGAGELDCPTVRALAEATRANVDNNLFALLVVGLLALAVTVVFLIRDGALHQLLDPRRPVLWGFAAAVALWVAGAVSWALAIDWLIERAHYLAAAGLFVCVLVVALVNARRQEGLAGRGVQDGPPWRMSGMLTTPNRYRYSWIAVAMVVVGVVAFVMMISGAITLFWVEIIVAGLFVVFWVTQTLEQDRPGS